MVSRWSPKGVPPVGIRAVSSRGPSIWVPQGFCPVLVPQCRSPLWVSEGASPRVDPQRLTHPQVWFPSCFVLERGPQGSPSRGFPQGSPRVCSPGVVPHGVAPSGCPPRGVPVGSANVCSQGGPSMWVPQCGSPDRGLPTFPNGRPPHWSPDGGPLIVFLQVGSAKGVQCGASGGSPRVVPKVGPPICSPKWVSKGSVTQGGPPWLSPGCVLPGFLQGGPAVWLSQGFPHCGSLVVFPPIRCAPKYFPKRCSPEGVTNYLGCFPNFFPGLFPRRLSEIFLVLFPTCPGMLSKYLSSGPFSRKVRCRSSVT